MIAVGFYAIFFCSRKSSFLRKCLKHYTKLIKAAVAECCIGVVNDKFNTSIVCTQANISQLLVKAIESANLIVEGS